MIRLNVIVEQFDENDECIDSVEWTTLQIVPGTQAGEVNKLCDNLGMMPVLDYQKTA